MKAVLTKYSIEFEYKTFSHNLPFRKPKIKFQLCRMIRQDLGNDDRQKS